MLESIAALDVSVLARQLLEGDIFGAIKAMGNMSAYRQRASSPRI